MIQAVLFDFNGVVIDDEALQMKAYQECLRGAGVELTEADYYGSLGMDDPTFVRAAFERAGRELDDETLRATIERKTELHRGLMEDGLPLFPGAVNFIKALGHFYPLGLVSMARRTEIDYALGRAGLERVFEVVVSAEEAPRCKPDPCCYERALEMLNRNRAGAHVLPLRPEECLAVEDSPPGVASARAAWMHRLAVTNTVADREPSEAGAEDVSRYLGDWTVDARRHL